MGQGSPSRFRAARAKHLGGRSEGTSAPRCSGSLAERNRTAIQTIAPILAHFHISENDRGTPGDGHVQWDEVFSSLAEVKYDGWLTIEAFSRNDPDFANAINVWREYSKPWDMAINGLSFIKQQGIVHGL